MILKLQAKLPEALDVFSFIFEPEQEIRWQAGQFLRYKLNHPDSDNRGVNRFFTIASAPSEKVIRLTTRFTDDGSSFKKKLRILKVGENIEAFGPSGNFILEDINKDYTFIAGGIGITPFRAILLDLAERGGTGRIRLIYANRDNTIIFKETLEELKQRLNLEINYIISPQRIDEELLARSLSKNERYYISGPEPMIKSIEEALIRLGIEDDNLKRDFFSGYMD